MSQSALVFPRRAWDWLFLALAHRKLGRDEEAKKDLQEAVDWVDRADRPGTTRPMSWIYWTETNEVTQILREAKNLIR